MGGKAVGVFVLCSYHFILTVRRISVFTEKDGILGISAFIPDLKSYIQHINLLYRLTVIDETHG